MDLSTAIILAVAAVIVVSVFVVLISLRVRMNKAAKRSRTQRQAEKTALWASAVVTDICSGKTGESGGKARFTLTLEVSPPQGTPYRAIVVWLVDMSALHLASPGSHVPVKLVPADPQKILPAVLWASYVGR